MKTLDDSSFAKEIKTANGYTLVDFWAEWCGPCRALGPVVDAVGAELEGRLNVAKVNVDQSPETAAQHGIRSIPTMILFRDGAPVASHVGSTSKVNLLRWLSTHMGA